jgi:AcrR family transcriptional regulator
MSQFSKRSETGGSMPKRAAERIRDTARALFYKEGIRAVGVEQIVNRAGVTKPSLYRSFTSKDSLAVAYLEDYDCDFWVQFDAEMAPGAADPRQQIISYFTRRAGYALRPGYRGCGLTNAVLEYPQEGHPTHAIALANKQRLRARLAAMARAMGAARPDELGDGLLLLLEGLFVSGQLFGPGGPAGSVAAVATALIDAHLAEAGVRPVPAAE